MKKINIIIGFALLICTMSFSQVGIGTQNPDKSSILDITSTNKGVLFPRVNLTSATMDLDANATTTQPAGMLVYNSGTTLSKGHYFWNGTEWRAFANITSVVPNITGLDCSSAKIEPSTYTVNQPYSGVLVVPYSGGNGGSYGVGTPITSTGVTGLTATLQEGNLAYGNGQLVFSVTGTPSASSPAAANFAIPALFGVPAGCTATVGAGISLPIGGVITSSYVIPSCTFPVGTNFNFNTYVTSNGLTALPVIDGIRINYSHYMQAVDRCAVQTGSSNRSSLLIDNISGAPLYYQGGGMSCGSGCTIPTGSSSTILYPGNSTIGSDKSFVIHIKVNATTWKLYEFRWMSYVPYGNPANETKDIVLYFSVRRIG